MRSRKLKSELSSVLTVSEFLYVSCKGKGYKTLTSNTYKSSLDLIDAYFAVGLPACLTIVPIIYRSVMGGNAMYVCEINKWLGCPLSDMSLLHESLGILLRAGLISKSYDRDEVAKFALKQKVLTCLLKGKKITILKDEEKTLMRFLEQLYNTLESFESDEIEEGMFYHQADTLLDEYAGVKELAIIKDLPLTASDRYLFLLAAYESIVNEKSGVDVDELMKKLCYTSLKRRRDSDALLKKKHPLYLHNLLTFSSGNYFSVEWMMLGEYAMKLFLGSEHIGKKQFSPSKGVLITPNKESEIVLFYNKKERETFDQLSESLSSLRLKDLFAEYRNNNQPENLTVLLQGGPGVGKTSSVYSIASKTGRLVYRVEIDKIHDMFVGESEKNISKIFSEYESLKEQETECPILLLNECDNLLKSRITNERSSVDQMANNLTTMMLEKMENFSGILFATVNKIHFDEAFFRRFMYKIEMTQPTAETRFQIFLHLFPGICKEFASSIANKYNLTGANISNIRKKYILISKSKEQKQIEEYIDELCREELFMQSNRVVISGFQISKN